MKKQKMSMLLATAVLAVTVLTGCGQNPADTGFELEEGQSDLEYVQSKETLMVGITDFAPMDYRDGEDWTGFDADLAKAFGESKCVPESFL
ncbi:MAG: hypothetical protein ACI4A3_02595 [Lachnospiraceae bacterium]